MGLLARSHRSQHAEASTVAACAAIPVDTAVLPLTVASWPAGFVRFDGEVLAFGAGELYLISLRALQAIEIRPKGGKLQVQLRYRAGLDHVRTSVWIERAHEPTLRQLVETVCAALSSQSPALA